MPDPNQASAVITSRPANRTLKIVIIVFGVLFLAVVSELGYYFYTTAKKNSALKDQEISSTTPGGGQTKLNIEKALMFGEDLDKTPGDFFKQAEIRSTLEGKVVSVEKKNIFLYPTNYAYTLFMEDTNKKTNRWYVSQAEIDSAKIYLLSPSGNKQKIGFDDIKPGDFISAYQIVDLLDPNPEYDVTLTVTRSQ